MNQNPFPAPPWPGWSTTALLGRGGFGAVYEIERDNFGSVEQAAMKVITIPQNDSDIQELYADGYTVESVSERYTEHMKSIVHEYSMMARLKGCANVVYCDDVYQQRHDDGVGWDIFIRMELLTPLPKALAAEYDEAAAIRLGADLANALRVCQGQKIIHRDIKPQNIFVSTDGTCKLGDFGIAKVTERTMSGTKIGTYKYMAPEVYHDAPYGAAADVYSLGMVLYWLMNERRAPFMPLPPAIPTHEQEEQAKTRRFAGEALPEPKHGSEALKALVLRCCAYDPADRPDIKALSDDLRRLQLKQLLKQADADLTEPEAETVRPAAPDEEEGEPTIPPTDWTLPVERKPLQKPERPITPDKEDREPTIPPKKLTRRPGVSPKQSVLDAEIESADDTAAIADQKLTEQSQETHTENADVKEGKASPVISGSEAIERPKKVERVRQGNRGLIFGVLALIIIGCLVATAVFMNSMSGNSETANQTQSVAEPERYYSDKTQLYLKVNEDHSQLVNAMKAFESRYGVKPYVYITDYIGGKGDPAEEEINQFLKARYNEFFSDENGFLFVIYDIQETAYTSDYRVGQTAKTVLNDDWEFYFKGCQWSCFSDTLSKGAISDQIETLLTDIFQQAVTID